MVSNIKFHHYGLAIKTFKQAELFHKNIGYTINDEVYDSEQNVILKLCTSETFPNVELVKPNNSDSPINGFLKSTNEIIYHVCYEVNLKKNPIAKIFSKNEFTCVSKPKPAILFGGRNVSFYYLKNIGLIEILER